MELLLREFRLRCNIIFQGLLEKFYRHNLLTYAPHPFTVLVNLNHFESREIKNMELAKALALGSIFEASQDKDLTIFETLKEAFQSVNKENTIIRIDAQMVGNKEDSSTLPATAALIDNQPYTALHFISSLLESGASPAQTFVRVAKNPNNRDQVNANIAALRALSEETNHNPAVDAEITEIVTALKSEGYTEEYLPALAQ